MPNPDRITVFGFISQARPSLGPKLLVSGYRIVFDRPDTWPGSTSCPVATLKLDCRLWTSLPGSSRSYLRPRFRVSALVIRQESWANQDRSHFRNPKVPGNSARVIALPVPIAKSARAAAEDGLPI